MRNQQNIEWGNNLLSPTPINHRIHYFWSIILNKKIGEWGWETLKHLLFWWSIFRKKVKKVVGWSTSNMFLKSEPKSENLVSHLANSDPAEISRVWQIFIFQIWMVLRFKWNDTINTNHYQPASTLETLINNWLIELIKLWATF